MRAVVEIKGGFGNQIFQYSFANYLRNKGYKVTVNINKIIFKQGSNRYPLSNNNEVLNFIGILKYENQYPL